MKKAKPRHFDDLRGAGRLAVQATTSVTTLVEEMHRTIASGPDVLGRPLEGPARLLTAAVYGGIRGVTTWVGAGLDLALAQLEPLLIPLLGSGTSVPDREALLAVLNGVLGDYLVETNNPLAIDMSFRVGGRSLLLEREALREAVPEACGKLLVLVHGSCLNDLAWRRKSHDHGEALARDLGYTPVYLNYNSGAHISTNGTAFAALLEALVSQWPVPVESLSILGHSMGGLVARSACHAADVAGYAWRRLLAKLVCLASPHHGAPLERFGNLFELGLGISRYSAPLATLGRLRSAGVTDLRFGNVLDEHWHGRDRFVRHPDPRGMLSLPEGVQCYALAATLSTKPGNRLRGDGLVPVDSALGRHEHRALTLAFPREHQATCFATNHVEVLNKPEVYDIIKRWLSAASG